MHSMCCCMHWHSRDELWQPMALYLCVPLHVVKQWMCADVHFDAVVEFGVVAGGDHDAGGSSKSASAGAGASALVPFSHFHGVVKVCGPGEDICGNCGEVVPTANLALHELRCKRQSFRCPHCSELLQASERDAHLDTSEATILAAGSAGMCVFITRMYIRMCVCVCVCMYIHKCT